VAMWSALGIKVAVEKGYRVYASMPEAVGKMQGCRHFCGRRLDDLCVRWTGADATPKKIAAANLERYRAAGVKAIFQGGEKHSLPVTHSWPS